MFKLVHKEPGITKTIPMCDMPPCSIGIIRDTYYHNDTIVMRTASIYGEIMNLSHPGLGGCWEIHATTQVELLKPGAKIILEVI